jgi:uncharacterized protein YndB with AHSA1/START domain
MPDVKSDRSERELVFSRVLDAPLDLVWEIWTNPEHIARWWGPAGFTNTIRKMEVRTGGEWDLTMRGPDGTDYAIRCVFTEVIPQKKLVYQQFANFRCIATIEFERRGKKTFLSWQMLFESKEYLIEVAREFGVKDGFGQNVERLLDYLVQQTH